jgi:hypothetical protein
VVVHAAGVEDELLVDGRAQRTKLLRAWLRLSGGRKSSETPPPVTTILFSRTDQTCRVAYGRLRDAEHPVGLPDQLGSRPVGARTAASGICWSRNTAGIMSWSVM